MGIAYSGSTIIDRTITTVGPDFNASLLSQLDAALTAAGWPSESIAGGKKYTLVSPQMRRDGTGPLRAKLAIWAGEDTGRLLVQMMSYDELTVGPQVYLRSQYYGPMTFRVIVGVCQLFLATPGVDFSGDIRGRALQCGIPYVPPAESCAIERGDVLPNDAWWMQADLGGGDGDSFRTHPSPAAVYAAFWDDALTTDLDPLVKLQLVQFAPVTDFWTGLISVAPLEFPDGADGYYPPWLAWGSPSRLRGVLYDAMMSTKHRELDAEFAAIDTGTMYDWFNFLHSEPAGPWADGGSYFASLLLLRKNPSTVTGTPGNYAY